MTVLQAAPPVSEADYRRAAEEAGVEFGGGKFAEKPPMSIEGAKVIVRILRLLDTAAQADGGADVFSESLPYRCYAEDSRKFRKSDASVVRTERLVGIDMSDWSCAIPADLVVEVIAPTNLAEGIIEKVEEYLQNGFKLVWVVYLKTRTVMVYRPDGGVSHLHAADEITGEVALPSFRRRVGEFFGK